MMTIKFAMIAMMISSSTYAPMHVENINNMIEHPKAEIEVVKETASIENSSLEVKDVAKSEETGAINYINKGKTYEECMKEAFERIYAEVNRMLAEIPAQSKDQFQNMM